MNHCAVSVPEVTTALFVSEAATSRPQFQLVYRLNDAVLAGKFQVSNNWSIRMEVRNRGAPNGVPFHDVHARHNEPQG